MTLTETLIFLLLKMLMVVMLLLLLMRLRLIAGGASFPATDMDVYLHRGSGDDVGLDLSYRRHYHHVFNTIVSITIDVNNSLPTGRALTLRDSNVDSGSRIRVRYTLEHGDFWTRRSRTKGKLGIRRRE